MCGACIGTVYKQYSYIHVHVCMSRKVTYHVRRSRSHIGRSKVTYLGGPHRGANAVHHLGDIVH